MKTKITIIVLFILCLILPTITWPIAKSFVNVEISENRELKQFPKFGNQFILDFESYYIDHAPYRSVNIKINSDVDRFFSGIYSNILTKLNIDHYESKNNVLFGENEWLFYLGDDSLSFYTGSNAVTEQELKEYAKKTQLVSDYFKSQGKEFVIYIAPNKEQVYSEYMPKSISVTKNPKRLQTIDYYLNENTDVNFIYPLQELLNNKTNAQLYYKQDTHWNKAGAAYGTIELLKSLNIACSDFEMQEYKTYVGDLSNMLAVAPKEDVDYQITLNNLDSYVSNKKLTLFGDSFRGGMSEPVKSVFQNSYIDHYNNFNINEDYELIENSDIIVFVAVERYTGRILDNGAILDQIINYYNLKEV